MVGSLLRWSVALVISLTACGAVLYYLDPVLGESSQRRFWVNFIPVAAAWLLFFIILRRPLMVAALTSSLVWLLYFINEQKLLHLKEPLLFADFFLLPQIISGWDLMGQYLAWWHLPLMLAVGALIYLFFRYERAFFSVRYSALTVCVATLLLMNLTLGRSVSAGLTALSENDFAPWGYSDMAGSHGLLPSLVLGATMVKFSKPAFDREKIESFKNSPLYEADALTERAALEPDIVLWLSESFFDVGALADVDSCVVWVGWCELLEQGLSGRMRVPTFGGNTTRTEFEVLTAIPFASLAGHDYPYISVVNSRVASLVWQLKNAGYSTLAIHAYDRAFWLRNRAYPLLGFDDFWGDHHAAFRGKSRAGYYFSDEALKEIVIEQLQKEADQPQFIMAISMENHGPWGRRPNVEEDRLAGIEVPEQLPEEHWRAWREYLYHGQNAVTELNRLYEFALSRERPTLILFFGDHLPAHVAYQSLAFSDGQTASRQTLPFVALANYSLESEWIPEAAHQLGPWLLGLAEQLGDGHYHQLHSLLKQRANAEDAVTRDALSEVLPAMQMRQFYPLH